MRYIARPSTLAHNTFPGSTVYRPLLVFYCCLVLGLGVFIISFLHIVFLDGVCMLHGVGQYMEHTHSSCLCLLQAPWHRACSKRGNSARVILSYTLDLQQGKVISSAESPGGVGSLAWLHLGWENRSQLLGSRLSDPHEEKCSL